MTLKRISGFSNYAIEDNGNVYSYKRSAEGQLLTPSNSPTSPYNKVSLVNDAGESKTLAVHRLVAETFIKNPKNYNIVNHIDGDKLNNEVTNLEWTDHKGNAKHAVEKLGAGQAAARQEKRYQDLLARLKIINHAKTACTGNPELFESIVVAALQDCKQVA